MEFYNELKQLLANSQQSDATIRKQAESEIKRLRDQDPRKFLASLTKEVADESNSDSVRMLAALIFKNFIANRGSDPRFQDYWVNLNADFKENIKQAMMANLAAISSQVRSQVAYAVATIASIEIPRREWLELIPNLCQNAGNVNIDYKNVALQTLGYICEELMIDDISNELKSQIVAALAQNITADPAMLKSTSLAIKAFFQALPFASQNFKVAQERDFIISRLFEAFQSQDPDIKVIAMQTLVEIARQEYESVEFFFGQVGQITAEAARGQDERLGAQGIEFWTSLAEEEYNRMKKNGLVKGYINQCSTQLVELLIESIQKVNIEDEEEEDDELGVALSAGCCLAAVSLVIGNNIIDPVIAFVSQSIQSPDWKKRYSALLSLGAITEGPEKIRFMQVVLPGFQNLINMFTDPNGKVREAIAWVMSKICEHHSDVIISVPETLSLVINVFLHAIKDKPRISNQICRAIEFLATSTASSERNPLNQYFKTLFQVLIENAHRTDFEGTSADLSLASFAALSAVCEGASIEINDELYSMLMPILQLLEKTLNIDIQQFGEKRAKDFQDYLAGLLQIILVKVGHKLDDQTASNIVKLLILIFQSLKRVTENGLIAFSGLINGVGSRLNINEFGQYIVWALQGTDDECVRLACGIVSDLAGALSDRVSIYLNDFVPQLLKILRDQNQDRRSKLQAIVALGDLAMNSGETFSQQYLPDVLKILESAAQQSLVLAGSIDGEDPELAQYLVQLRETLVECYTTIVHGVTLAQTKANLVGFAPNILGFLQSLVSQPGQQASKDLIRNILGLIGDIASCIGPYIKDLLKQPYIEKMIIAMTNEPDQDSKEAAQWALEQIKSALQIQV